MKKFVCKHPWSHFEVNNPNGDVTMCCNNDTVLGNVNDGSIADAWNGPKFKAIRKRMAKEGAHAFCPHTCPVLQGGKKYENLDWYDELRNDSAARRNAVLNEREYAERREELSSAPRWLRFTYSYACNLDCYHCYQREDAKIRLKLPESFMLEVPEYAKKSQVIYPFGGEPFFFKPVLDFLENHDPELDSRFFFITNATLLTDRIYETLERLPITCMAVSLDAATAESFEALRVRGRNADWETVMTNMERLRELKRGKHFTFNVSMTLNSINCGEIERFVDLALAVDAEPLVMLVANPYQTSDFQKKFLIFTQQQMDDMFIQIERALDKVRAVGLEDPETFLKLLRTALRHHREHDNRLLNFNAGNIARKAFHMLPEQFQGPVRRVVQEIRTRSFDSYADGDAS